MSVTATRPQRRALLVWLVLSTLGVAVLLAPDSGTLLVRLSRTHTPSAQDLVGVVLLLAGWTVYLVALWRVRSRIRCRALLAAVAVPAAALRTWSVLTDTGAWWVLGAVALAGVQVAAGWAAQPRPRTGGPADVS